MTRLVPRKGGSIDWQALRERLARAEAALARVLELSPERAQAVMNERARALARPVTDPAPARDAIEILTFALGRERYAIETRFVREVARLSEFTPVPSAPEFILGIVNLRGEVLAVVDLRKFLGIDSGGVTDLSRVVVLGTEEAELGILADSVDAVERLPPARILEPPVSVAGIAREYLRGVTSDALIVLSGAALLEDERLVVDQSETFNLA